ncbi:unnamed protein product [Rangifer tarandus platyrhynchus]|uniref:Uncharacterized protein n=1 Tax=Rangifer tarandus platyrhynchus TaxID=3082113 RepID=A0ABN9A4X9_RANTA|nr:unnamed protein product [Rangifer tarandus platyrhynchus]
MPPSAVWRVGVAPREPPTPTQAAQDPVTHLAQAASRFLPRVSLLRSGAGRSHRCSLGGTGSCSCSHSRALGLQHRAPSTAATTASVAEAGLSHGGYILTEPTAVLMP